MNKCPDSECDGTVTTTIDDQASGRATESCDGCSYVRDIPGNGKVVGGLKVERRDVSGAMWLAGVIGFSIGVGLLAMVVSFLIKGCH